MVFTCGCASNIDKKAKGDLRIHFIDVGQGDCVLIELPNDKVALIDSGSKKKGYGKKVFKHLKAYGVQKINYLIVTHTDSDHVSNLSSLIEEVAIESAYLPTSYGESTKYNEFCAKLERTACKIKYTEMYDDLSEDSQDFLFRVISRSYDLPSPEGQLAQTQNELSSVLYLEYKGTKALFTGDIGKEGEYSLLKDKNIFETLYGIDLENIDVLKVAHHGSETSSSEIFVEHVSPKYAIISVGENNYGQPNSEVIKRLVDSNKDVNILRTDINGDIVFTVNDFGFSVVYER